MIILGIDPGVARVGYGVLEANGDRIVASSHGCIETAKTEMHGNRLVAVRQGMEALINRYNPAVIGLEKLFFEKNVKTALSVSEARGVLLLVAAERKIPVIEMTPLQVKQSITGNGRADKRQMQEMVKILLKLSVIPKPDDAADALAIAMTCLRLSRSDLRGPTSEVGPRKQG